MDCNNYARFSTRRQVLTQTCYGLGAAALHMLLGGTPANAADRPFPNFAPGLNE